MSFLAASFLIILTLVRVLIPSSLPPHPRGGTPYKRKRNIKKKHLLQNREENNKYFPIEYKKKYKTTEQKEYSPPLTTSPPSTKTPYGSNLKGKLSLSIPNTAPSIYLASSRGKDKKKKDTSTTKNIYPISSSTKPLFSLLKKKPQLQKAILYTEIFNRKYF